MTDFNILVSTKPIQSFKEISDSGIISQSMLFKLYRTGQIEVIKIGNRNNVSRLELIRYLNENTIARTA